MGVLDIGAGQFKQQADLKKPMLDYSQLPGTGREWDPKKESYESYTDRCQKMAEHLSYSGYFIRCERHGQAAIIFTCQHCHEQDPVHPQGMVFTPYRFYLCKFCFNKYELHQLQLGLVLATTCWNCVLDEWNRVRKLDPTKVKDFSNEAKNHR